MIAKGVLFIDDISDQFHLSPGKTYIVKKLSFYILQHFKLYLLGIF